jgi:hypothetical protein
VGGIDGSFNGMKINLTLVNEIGVDVVVDLQGNRKKVDTTEEEKMAEGQSCEGGVTCEPRVGRGTLPLIKQNQLQEIVVRIRNMFCSFPHTRS